MLCKHSVAFNVMVYKETHYFLATSTIAISYPEVNWLSEMANYILATYQPQENYFTKFTIYRESKY